MKNKEQVLDLILCLIYAVVIQGYFISLNIIKSMPIYDIYTKISYIIFIVISIIMFEIAYKKGKTKTIVTGIEFIVLAIHTLLIERIVNTQNTEKISILATSYVWPIYYCLKAMIIHTKENRKKLRQISDIVEIVKEEKPTKKVAKKRKK